MSKSTTLRAADARAIINLVGECRESGDDWNGWVEHWNRGLLKLIDADLGMSGEIAGAHGRRPQIASRPVISGQPGFAFDPHRVEAAIEYSGKNWNEFEFIVKYLDKMSEDDGVALTNRDFYRDREWRASREMQTVGEAYGTDPALLCFRLMPRAGRDESLNVSICRAKGRRYFKARDCVIVREAVAAIAPLMGGPLARFADPSPADLAPRVRRVLACFLEGDGDKQVATRLGISTHTVNQYAKVIFQHFGVRSRPELLARWIRRGWSGQFPWVD